MTTKDNRTPTSWPKPKGITASGQDSQSTNHNPATILRASAASNHPGGHEALEAHSSTAVGGQTTETAHFRRENQDAPGGFGSNDPAPKEATELKQAPARGTDSRQPIRQTVLIPASVAEHDFTNAQSRCTTQNPSGVGEPTSQTGHGRADDQKSAAGLGPILADPILGMAADVVDDLERVRIANENRLRTLTATDEHGHGLTVDHPDVARLSVIVDSLIEAEKQAVKNLQKVMRAHPLGPWVKASTGVGEKQAARLLAVIRDPCWNDLHDRPRALGELRAYCGFHVLHPGAHLGTDTQRLGGAGVAPKRQRGQRANWNEDARKRLWLIAASCVKQKPEASRYRRVYDETRAHYADAVHQAECVRCGPKGKPAQPGSSLSLGHQHARGIRAIAKEILRDLWLESKRLHEARLTEEVAAA